ncbi:hypothetical protein EVAR_23596_1 [Eumeta japonica]|uniref:Uncharacterized protein n=1 Tax=Eumeta variegata TaxID=151549 RepID=A0A4C1X1G3_EUMVA|nr:hypothetical protein EVAR_23596_1 [Eumeta japonica]
MRILLSKDNQNATYFLKRLGSEVPASVDRNFQGDSKSGEPLIDESLCHRYCFSVWSSKRFQPLRETQGLSRQGYICSRVGYRKWSSDIYGCQFLW